MTKRIIILGAIVLLVVLGWTGGWFFLAGQLRQQVAALAFADGETAPQLSCASLDIGGFPFRFDLDCRDAVIVTGDLLFELPEARASAMVYRPNHLLAWASGPLEISDAFTGQRSTLDWTGAEASLRLEDWRIARLSLVANSLVWTDRLFEALIARTGPLEVHLLDMPEAHDPERRLAALAVYGRAQAVEAPGLDMDGAEAELEAEITGLPDDIRAFGAEPLLPLWHRQGGVLRLTRLHASDASAQLDASGDLSLDAAGLANGSIDITSKGVAERIGPLIEEPWRTLVLGVPAADGSHRNQLNLRAGTLSSGLVPVTTLPPLF